jgi:steroid 5-alpha reductase family enzyme
MAIPVLRTLEECSDFSSTVEPFLPQLYALPARLLDNITSRDALVQLYAETNPLVTAFAASVFLGAVFLVGAEVTRNYSQVDRFWSVGPNLYIAHFALWARVAGVHHQRVDLILAFSTIWSVSGAFWHLTGLANTK